MAGDRPKKEQVLLTVKERIEESYCENGAALFVPEQFVAANLGQLNEVEESLFALAKDHFLVMQADVKCAAGHSYWGGELRDLQDSKALRTACPTPGCPTTDENENGDEDNQPRVFVRYAMTPPWKNALASKKKQSQ